MNSTTASCTLESLLATVQQIKRRNGQFLHEKVGDKLTFITGVETVPELARELYLELEEGATDTHGKVCGVTLRTTPGLGGVMAARDETWEDPLGLLRRPAPPWMYGALCVKDCTSHALTTFP